MTLDALTSAPQSDPTDLYRMRDGLYAVDLLGAALVEFDFFTWLDRQPGDLPTLCRGLGIEERPADVMLTLFAALGLVQRQGEIFETTAKAREFLVRGAPLYMGAYYAALKDRPVCRDFIRVLRSGKPANWGSFKDEKAWADAMGDASFANSFTAAMDCRGRVLGQALAARLDCAGQTSLLDVAGGSGIYACAMAARHPHLKATVFEKAPVDTVAARAIADHGLAGRVSVACGDMFKDPWPAGHDAHLISNVLHDWDVPEARQILQRSVDALPAGGLLVVHDAFLDEAKTGPLPVAMYSCLLMHSSEGRCYSRGEMRAWLMDLGFTDIQFTPTVLDRGFISARKDGRFGIRHSQFGI